MGGLAGAAAQAGDISPGEIFETFQTKKVSDSLLHTPTHPRSSLPLRTSVW
jgi:hypothetical protein